MVLGRAQVIDSGPYYASGLTALIKAGDARIAKIADLKGKTVLQEEVRTNLMPLGCRTLADLRRDRVWRK